MDSNKDKLRKVSKWIIAIAAACIVIYLTLRNIGPVSDAAMWLVNLASPLIIGFFIALVLNVPMRFFESFMWPKATKKFPNAIRRPLAYLMSLILILGILVGVVWLIIPELVNAFRVLADSTIQLLKEMQQRQLSGETASLPFGITVDWNGIVRTIESWIRTQSGNIVNVAVDTLSSLAGGVINGVFAFIFSIYILFSKETLKKQACRILRAWAPKVYGEKIIHATSVANRVFRNFVSGQTLESIILGTLCTIGMLILQLPYAPMVGALVGVASLIPVVGAFIGAGIGAFMIFMESPIQSLVFIIFIIALQQIEGNLIYPRVMGTKINLPPIWVLAAVTIGGAFAGPLGILLGIPFASTVYELAKEATRNREKKLGITSDTPCTDSIEKTENKE